MAKLFLVSEISGEILSHAIFFHGLQGDPFITWCTPSNSDDCWIKWLSEDIENLAVWTVGYQAATSRWFGHAMHLSDRATNVLERLLLEPSLQVGDITLIGHSLGGLLIKQMLRVADSMSDQRPEVASFLKRIRRVGFIATPHAGSGISTIADRLRILVRPSAATASLVRNDPHLRELNFWYREWIQTQSIAHLTLVESQPTYILFNVVKPDSSDPGLSERPICIDADHSTICKPKDRSSEVYLHIHAFLTKTREVERTEPELSRLIIDQGERIEDVTQKVDTLITNASIRNYPSEIVDREINKRLERIKKARFFARFSLLEDTLQLAEAIEHGELSGGSNTEKCKVLAWCARFLALGEAGDKADSILRASKLLGHNEEVAIAEALRIAAKDDFETALSNLSNIKSPNSIGASFLVVNNKKGAEAAFDWMTRSGLNFTNLDSDGKFVFTNRLLEVGRWEKALECVNELEETDYQSAPILLYVAGISYLMKSVPDELKSSILRQVPIEARTFPLASDESSLIDRRKARDYFGRCAEEARNLDCVEEANVADDFSLWLGLRDSLTENDALEELKESMRDPAHSLRRLHYALQFGVNVDRDRVEREIEEQTAVSGGKSMDAAMARFSLAFTLGSPKAIARYIADHRQQLQKLFEGHSLDTIEIEMLAKAGLSQHAQERLNEAIEEGLTEEEQTHLRSRIAESTGSDAFEIRRSAYEQSGEFQDLINIVKFLEEKEDWERLREFAEILYDKTGDLADAERLVKAFTAEKCYGDVVALLRKHAELIEQSLYIQSVWCWSLYYEGLIKESLEALEKLRAKRDDPNDRALFVNLIISSGDWKSLSPYIEHEWSNRDHRDAGELLITAQLAHSLNSPRAKELTIEAVNKCNDDANVLATAYILASRAGWEDNELVAKWMEDAARLSDETGPIQKVGIKEIVQRKPDWDRRESETWDKLTEGTLPIFGVGRLLNRSLFDMFLMPALSNPMEPDPRKRALIPAYSGVRNPVQFSGKNIGLEATSLLTLASLKLLELTDDAFEHIYVPHSLMGWLFKEISDASFHQPSRIRDATKLSQLLGSGALKTFSASGTVNSSLADEVGTELASLLTEARTTTEETEKQKLVIRPAPVHRVRSLMEEEADLSSYHDSLCSCWALVQKLKAKGQLTTSEESRAKAYLSLHERNWPGSQEIPDGAVLYLDDLSVSYLQHLDLLDKLRPAGLTAFITPHEAGEISTLLGYDQLTQKAEEIAEDLRQFLSNGIKTGKIQIGRLNRPDDEESSEHHPTFGVFEIAKKVDAIVVDDRFLNQHGFMETDIPILTSLDLVEILCASGKITLSQALDLRTSLRRANYLFIPLTVEELEHHMNSAEVSDGHLKESAELRAIRENLLRIRMSCCLQIPKEAYWLDSLFKAIANTIKSQWRPEVDKSIAKARANWLGQLLDIRGWAHVLADVRHMGVPDHGYGAHILVLLLTPSDMSEEMQTEYWAWLEKTILKKIREESPEIYSWAINRVKALISDAVSRSLDRG